MRVSSSPAAATRSLIAWAKGMSADGGRTMTVKSAIPEARVIISDC